MTEGTCIQKWRKQFTDLWGNRLIFAILVLTATGSYGFFITHHTIGVDDTAYALYFEEGRIVAMGRWFPFLLNKLFDVAEFVPFITDLAGVLILMAAVTIWGTLLCSVCGERIPRWGYLFFSCIFLSCPLLAEVYPYYLHNSVSVGYLCTGISLCFFRELTEWHGGWKKMLTQAGGMICFLIVPLGCYESFMIVWIVGIFLILLTEGYMGILRGGKAFRLLGTAALSASSAMVLRGLMLQVLVRALGLTSMRQAIESRSGSVEELLGWLSGPDAAANFAMAVKRFYVMYFAFAYAYRPIRIFVAAVAFIGLYGLYSAARRKSLLILALTAGSLASCFLLVPVEGKVTLYRAAQFLPLICGYGAFLLIYAITVPRGRSRTAGRLATSVSVFLLSAVLWNQCYEMNKWFYVDWLKYRSDVNLAEQIDAVLKKDFDPLKPVVFIGNYAPPESIIGDAYVKYGTKTFFQIKRLTDPVDEHLLEKFYREYGVWVAQTPALSVYAWGVDAFGSDEELARFFAMHGLHVTPNTNPAYFEEASGYFLNMPSFPQKGSIEDRGAYIIVRL